MEMTAPQQPSPANEALHTAKPVGAVKGVGQDRPPPTPQQRAFWPELRPAGVGVDARSTSLSGLLPIQSIPSCLFTAGKPTPSGFIRS